MSDPGQLFEVLHSIIETADCNNDSRCFCCRGSSCDLREPVYHYRKELIFGFRSLRRPKNIGRHDL